MDCQHILYKTEGHVAYVVLNRPDKLNALGVGPGSNRVEIVEALEHADRDPHINAILITAAGRAFCAGGDMTGVPRMKTAQANQEFITDLERLMARMRAIRKPTVAAVQGLCLGSGLGLAAQFDFVLAADTARFGLVEGRVGHPGAVEIVPLVGAAWAKYLMLTGEIIDAYRAQSIGLVLTVEPEADLADRAADLVGRLARMPRESMISNKACIDAMAEVSGRAAGRAVGRAHDVTTRSLAQLAMAPDGRLFDDIVTAEGIAGMKAARDAQYGSPWLPPISAEDRVGDKGTD